MSSKPDDLTPEEIERQTTLAYGMELEIAALKDNPALAVLMKALEATEEGWALKLGGNILRSVKPLDQRQIDFTRGYFAGARAYLQGRVPLAQQRVAAYEADKRDLPDPRPTGQDDPRAQRSEDA